MLQAQSDAVTIAETDSTADPTSDHSVFGTVPSVHSTDYYADAHEFEWRQFEYYVRRFARAVFSRLEKDVDVDSARVVDTITPSKDIDDGMLLAFPDESLLFLGKDPTTTDETFPWYGFTIEPNEPVPAPDTAQDALDLLKPIEVQQVVEDEHWIPNRHGEWWLLPTALVPGGSTFTPGVQSRPYGPSPLGNHVPREWAFTVTDKTFMERFRENVDSAPNSIKSVPEAIQWSYRQQNKPCNIRPDDAPLWADIRDWGGDVLVKGTLRHRENDHFLENCHERWHKATTHRMEVYTADDVGDRVHLDYYGQ